MVSSLSPRYSSIFPLTHGRREAARLSRSTSSQGTASPDPAAVALATMAAAASAASLAARMAATPSTPSRRGRRRSDNPTKPSAEVARGRLSDFSSAPPSLVIQAGRLEIPRRPLSLVGFAASPDSDWGGGGGAPSLAALAGGFCSRGLRAAVAWSCAHFMRSRTLFRTSSARFFRLAACCSSIFFLKLATASSTSGAFSGSSSSSY
mmetsp:Transcript_5843/g.12370  ORF Transcript_5843/g.12370 Transcript_5843/m.12370 type:complete len:207 (-) Transcript_5843:895-1515(-)